MEAIFNVQIWDLRLFEDFDCLHSIICRLGAPFLVMPRLEHKVDRNGTAIGSMLRGFHPVSSSKFDRNVLKTGCSGFRQVMGTMSEQEKEKDKDPTTVVPAVRIFLVEDNPDHVFIALTVVRQVLGDDIELVHASNADEAMLMIAQFTENDRPDLFLVDLRLPDNGGFSVLQAARANEALAAVPMFVITSSLYDRDIAESYQLGASAVLCKPLSRAKLRDELVRVGALPMSQRPTDPAYRH
jgi:CheY-like chemotaxis protein